eukprot:TRINITY_DN22599_c0_g1_i1.p2 TRINITY_DN22599_c0_g1~~TRINITY_DN22599_c0_g1_i1.p2  ORF type:complete len:117 (+),score=24.01 TRINITY_DN22599_c0_g1_i1:147-497(+)
MSGLPVLLLWSVNDATTPFENCVRFRELVPQVEFYAIPNAMHVITYEAPVQVANIVANWLARMRVCSYGLPSLAHPAQEEPRRGIHRVADKWLPLAAAHWKHWTGIFGRAPAVFYS